MDISKFVKKCCVLRGMSVIDIAEKIGKTRQYVYVRLQKNDWTILELSNVFESLNLKLQIFNEKSNELKDLPKVKIQLDDLRKIFEIVGIELRFEIIDNETGKPVSFDI